MVTPMQLAAIGVFHKLGALNASLARRIPRLDLVVFRQDSHHASPVNLKVWRVIRHKCYGVKAYLAL